VFSFRNGDPDFTAGPPENDAVFMIQKIVMRYNTTSEDGAQYSGGSQDRGSQDRSSQNGTSSAAALASPMMMLAAAAAGGRLLIARFLS
jgi:hypothetical protein